MGFGYIPTRRKPDSFSMLTSPRKLEEFGAKRWCPLAKVFQNKDSALRQGRDNLANLKKRP